MNKKTWSAGACSRLAFLALFIAATLAADEPPRAALPSGETLTLERAVALALQNSRELALARMRHTVSERAAGVHRAAFLPNLFTGSGAAYSSGFPSSATGEAPAALNVSYIQTLLNSPARGRLRAANEESEVQRLSYEQTRDAIILRAATAYLELGKVRGSLDLLRRELESAQKITGVTRERSEAGLELPLEITRAELTAARIEQRIVALEGREESLEGELRKLTGIPPDQRIEVAREEVPVGAAQPVGELIQMALASNLEIRQAEHQLRSREHRLKGERGGYWPTVDLVGQYALLTRFNNYDEFYNRFERHNVNLGVQIRIPIFSARTSAAVALAESERNAAELELRNKRADIEQEVRRRARRTRELDAAREVARLELKVAQESLRVLQEGMEAGRANLRDVEKARLEEHEKWMAFLDAEYERQRAQLELLQSTGQLARVFQ